MATLLSLLKVDNEECLTPSFIETFYYDQLRSSGSKLIQPLELNQYLEKVLWPKYEDKGVDNVGHMMSVVTMINQKFREKVPAWETFVQLPDKFDKFFSNVCKLCLAEKKSLSMRERKSAIIFLDHCFNSVEVDLIRGTIQKYASFPMWVCLSENRRKQELKQAMNVKQTSKSKQVPTLQDYWNVLKKKDTKLDAKRLEELMFERKFLWNLIHQFFRFLATIPSQEEVEQLDKVQMNVVGYCERFLEFLIDLEALLSTRRFFNAVLDDTNAVVICQKSNLANRVNEGRLFNQLLEILIFYSKFEIDDITGKALTQKDMLKKHYDMMSKLQMLTFKNFESLKNFYLSNIASVDTPLKLIESFKHLNDEELTKLTIMLNISSESSSKSFPRDLILEMIAFRCGRVTSQLDALNEMPLYPTEDIIWDENLVPNQYFDNDSCLALPKLNLQFLTLHDYLLRNHKLFRLESTFEIRQDIEASVSRMKPWRREDGAVMFGGWARMAIVIDNFVIVEIAKPNVGEKAPSRVRAEIRVNLNVRNEIKREWESLRKHDVCFLITVEPTVPPGTAYKYKEPFKPQVGLKYVRGCEIEGMLDPLGKLIDESTTEKPHFDTDFRIYRVWLDCNQYYIDNINLADGQESVYDTFNILMRRKPKENNFKAVLETVRDLMNTQFVVPDWLHDIILGYGDPSAAHYTAMSDKSEIINFNDTFLDHEHLLEAFSNYEVTTSAHESKLIPPFKLKINEKDKKVEVYPFVLPNRGPYPAAQPKKNSVKFTPTQVEAIKSGIHRGLTLVVGPPGTGKTDVAVQIISNLYHNFPQQRTLIVTHSNQALNALFEKIMALDIDERHLLRLGHGEEELDTEKDFSRYGRVNYVLKKRLELLGEVSRLASSLNVSADVGYTCETANYFYLYHVLSRWEEFQSKLSESNKGPEDVARLFPFHKFFETAPQPIFHEVTFEQDLEIAKGCYRHLKKIFTQLDEFKAFEMLRSGNERSQYLLVREAKIIAMTCTHAALKRRELVEIGFQYDNILMEEAAQILEIETFIPLLLQNPEHGHNRLKRWIMIGDHHQLPPVIKNMAFQKFSNMEQSLFTRLVRLGVSTIELDAQGRSRPSLCSLFRQRYKKLDDLPHILSMPESFPVNPGFAYDYQLVDVQDFNGIGESEPIPYFYQNLAEAEYVVATYMFMRLIGYPAESITILTTYNGQKHLIRDVINQRCVNNPFIGAPHKVTTVDKYQGLQNDFILLSLVRTKTVGHLRDIRRLIVAMSRAKFGLYVFGRVSLFKSCIELAPTFNLLLQRPTSLHLFPEENYHPIIISERKSLTIFTEMTTMVQFVYDFYVKKVEEWKITRPELFKHIHEEKEKDENSDEPDDEKEYEQDDKQQDEQMGEHSEMEENDQKLEKRMHTSDDDEDNDHEEDDDVPFEKIAPDDTGTEDKLDIEIDL